MISCRGLKKSFGNTEILKNVTFTVGNGERISLIGPGGSGKTTILKMILGIIEPDAGKASLAGMDLNEIKPNARNEVYKKVGMAFQQGGLFDFMTIKENLFFAMEHMTDKNKEEMLLKVKELLSAVKLGRTEEMFPYQLSGGMRRRVGIARALCTEPEIAIFDEPTSGLDPVTSTIILNMISNLVKETPDAALLVSTSNVEIAIRFAERVVVINRGRVIADGPWKELLLSGSEWVKHFLGVRLIGLDIEYAHELGLPESFIEENWKHK